MTFGDWEEDDSFDLEPADPEQVARKLHRLRLDRGREPLEWDALGDVERSVLIDIIAGLLAWMRRQGAH
jgi:hypothetical protein